MTYEFKNGNEMLSTIKNGNDLYNPNTNTYVFLYNEAGSIAAYDWIDNNFASDLAREQEMWSGQLGPGGYIYDDPSYEDYDEMAMDNLDWCNNNYEGTWIDTDDLLEWLDTMKKKREVS